MHAVCLLSVIPCLAEAADASEMVTQLLFGETCEILEKEEKWWMIRTSFDDYECWVDPKQLTEINGAEYKQLNTKSKLFGSSELVGILQAEDSVRTLLMGSVLPAADRFEIAGQEFSVQTSCKALKEKTQRPKLIEDAYMYLNAPYLWGGKGPFGIDCSGFVQVVFRLNGIFLPRDAYQQADIGDTLSFVEEGQAGDLAFFDNENGKITHVGILIDAQHIIHASGKVRIDRIDHQGIFHEENGTYTHRLRLLKRIIK